MFDVRAKVKEAFEQTIEEKYMGFEKVAASAAKGGASDPGASAAAIGRKKYGAKAFQKAAAKGKKMRGMPVKG